jgi:hypothetical protein
MPTFQQIVKLAGSHLLTNEIGKQDHVRGMWQSVRWQPFAQNIADTDVELSLNRDPLIRLYPALLGNAKAAKAVLREFGLLLLARGGDRAEAIWEKKLLAPSQEQIETFATALADETTRARCHSYLDLIHTYPDKGHSVDRLVGIHFCNALLANNVSYGDSMGVNIHAWGPTAQFAARQKYFSLVPLTSAYCPGEIHRCFGCAFASLILDNLRAVPDLSVAAGLRLILRSVIQRSA